MSLDKDIGIPGSRYAYVSGVNVGKITRDSWLKTAFPE
jgi:hypothetical protein